MHSLVVAVLSFLVAQDDPSRQIRELLDKLRSDRIEERADAARKLKQLGKPAIPALEKAAKSSDSEVAGRVGQVIRAIEIADRLPASVRKTLPHIEDRMAAGDGPAWSQAFQEAASEDGRGELKHPSIRKKTLEFMADAAVVGSESAEQKAKVCAFIARWKLRSGIAGVIALLKDEDSSVRRSAAEALGELRPNEALQELVKCLDDKDSTVRVQAALTLASMRAKQAIPATIVLLKSREEMVAMSAAFALAFLQAEESIPEMLKMMDKKGSSARVFLPPCLALLGAKDAVPRIRELLNDGERDVRISAASALAELGVREAVPDLIKLLKDSESTVRASAARALGLLEAKEAIPALIGLLRQELNVGWSASGSLALMAAKEAIPELLKLLDDPKSFSAQMVFETLQYMDSSDAAPIAEKYLKREGTTDEFYASHWFCAMGLKQGVPSVLRLNWDLNTLNGVRQASTWKELRQKQSPLHLEGTAPEIVEKIARAANLTVEWPEPSSGSEEYWLSEWRQIEHIRGPATCLVALREVISEGALYRFVLEKDRIRVLPRAEALKFWKSWWQEEEKKQK